MKRFFGLISKLPFLVFLLIMTLMFIGAGSVMAFSSELMIVNQIDSQSMTMAECPHRDSYVLNYKNTAFNANYTSQPALTYQVGKIYRSLV